MHIVLRLTCLTVRDNKILGTRFRNKAFSVTINLPCRSSASSALLWPVYFARRIFVGHEHYKEVHHAVLASIMFIDIVAAAMKILFIVFKHQPGMFSCLTR